MTATLPIPAREQIALLQPFERLGIERISVVSNRAQAERALADLIDAPVLGFDTESKPTFVRAETSDGPHVVQFATPRHGYVFQLHDTDCRDAVAQLLRAQGVVKAGFGLGDDRRRIVGKLGIEPSDVLDLNAVFQRKGYRKDIGVRAAIAVVFNQRFIKSRKATTSNWANRQLSAAQVLYAANDAYAAIRVFDALGADAATATS